MDCIQFKKYWLSGDLNDLDYDLQDQVLNHLHNCQQCSDDALRKVLEDRGVRVNDYPCVHMAQYAEFYCEQHPNPKDCDDATILYNDVFDEYSIPHGDGRSQIGIRYCPWCGTKLPSSKRDEWFNEIEKLGFDDPHDNKIPKEFKSNKWRISS